MTDPQPDRLPEIRQRRVRDLMAAATEEDRGLAQFITHAPDDLDWLLAEVEGLRREVERLRQVNKAGSQQVEELLGNLGGWEQLVQDRNAEVERLRERLRETEERLHEAQITIGKLSHAMSEHEVERLRGLLRRLEWVNNDGVYVCPACGGDKHRPVYPPDAPVGHAPNCWLAKEIRPTSGEER